ncbi:hypothetical protein POPTR_003G038525v4 [Populus trichocarpa]|uniref:Uncharacterized protein n=1 Tax=Populus trichocarpa TaxID=3694 RepID=A0ACC0T7X0_POPTR|nr:hypothetical protein POPTR_003G038525v4 [Populus trichocarpa]
MWPAFWTVEIGNALSGKVLFMLNSSSSIFRRDCRICSVAWDFCASSSIRSIKAASGMILV